MEEDSSTSAGPSAAAPLTSYDKVYCGDVEGRLEVTNEGIFFRPTDATIAPNPATPYEIRWRDTTHRDFVQAVVQASVSSYTTEVGLFRLKLGVLPSKEVTFSMHNRGEWERLQSDLDARGYGPPEEETNDDDAAVDDAEDAQAAHTAPAPAAAPTATPVPAANDRAGAGVDVDVDDYDDNAETVHNDYNERAPEEDPEFTTEGYNEESFTQGVEVPDQSFDHDMSDMSHTYFAQSQAEDVNWEDEQRDDNIEKGDEGEEYDDGDEYSEDVGADEDESSIPNSTYYPVFHHGSVGSLVLTNSHLQFIPDKHSEPIKSLPWTSLAGDPVCSPSTYPQAVMTVRYHTTRGPQKKAGFDLDGNHEELQYLQEEICERMRPWRDAPRERVHVPTTKPKTNNAGLPEGFKLHQKSPLFPPRGDDSHSYSQTDDDMSTFGGTDTVASAVPLVERRRVPFHKKEETPRRMLMLFCSYCCLVSVTILTTMVIVGYFFGPRKPRDQYVRTQSPYSIQADYLGTEPPTPEPTFESWNSGTALMSRAPGATTMPAAEEEQPSGGRASDFDPFSNNSTFVNYTENTGDLPQRGGDFDIGTITAANGTSFDVSSPEPTVVPATPAPTIVHTRSDETVLNLLRDSSPDGGESIRTTGTPQQAAYLLVRISDVEEEATSDAMIAQKFALATFYYATDGNEWKDGADDWVDLAGSDCGKPHLDCAEFTGMVTGIDMPSNNMNGSIPPEIGMLKYLTHLNLKNNDLHGSLPTELGLLTNLQTLDVSGNPLLQGSVPEEVRALPSLQKIVVDLP